MPAELGTKPVAEGEGDVVATEDLAQLDEVRVEEAFLVCPRHHAAMIDPPRDTTPVTRRAVSGT